MQQGPYPPIGAGAGGGYQAYPGAGQQGGQGISRYGYNPPAQAAGVGEAEGFYR